MKSEVARTCYGNGNRPALAPASFPFRTNARFQHLRRLRLDFKTDRAARNEDTPGTNLLATKLAINGVIVSEHTGSWSGAAPSIS